MTRVAALLAAILALILAIAGQPLGAAAAAAMAVVIILATLLWRALDAPPTDQGGYRHNHPPEYARPGEDPGIGPTV